MRFITVILILFMTMSWKANAQRDSSVLKSGDTALPSYKQKDRLPFLDSVALAMQQHDQYVQDSLATLYIRPADPMRKDQLVDTLLKNNLYTGTNFLDIHTKSKSL